MATKPRSIFVDVDTTEKQVAQPGGIDRGGDGSRGAIRIWLMILFALVAISVSDFV